MQVAAGAEVLAEAPAAPPLMAFVAALVELRQRELALASSTPLRTHEHMFVPTSDRTPPELLARAQVRPALDEEGDEAGVEVLAGEATKLGEGLVDRPRGLVGAVGDER